MPRQARIDAPGALHHLIVRGIERKKIFRSDNDKQNFVERLGRLISETQTDCLAWALLSNHFHLLLRTGEVPISRLMRRLLTGHAVWFNKKYRRHGPLFQNRYKSILCQQDPYLKELVRYIHLNPIRAAMVDCMDALDRYPWAGHSALMGKIVHDWQNTMAVHRLFAETVGAARRRYRKFVESAMADGRRHDLTGGGLVRSAGGWAAIKATRKAGLRIKGDERILGDSDFVGEVLRSAEEAFKEKYYMEAQGYDFEWAVGRVAQVFSLEPDAVIAPGKSPPIVQARSLLCYWAQRKLGMKTVEIADKLGLCQSGVSRASVRGERIAKEGGLELKERKS